MKNIAKAISDSIRENKWLYIEYDSKSAGYVTKYWCAITDVFPDRKLAVTMYNDHISITDIKEGTISYDAIKVAQVLDFTTYDGAPGLADKIRKNPEKYEWLHFTNFDNNVLLYLTECNRLDRDPFQKKYVMITGIDYEVLKKELVFKLNETQIKEIITMIYNDDKEEVDNNDNELVISLLSVDSKDKKYVIAYRDVFFDPKGLSLKLKGGVKVNSTFLIDGITHSLSRYTDISAADFTDMIETDFEEAKHEIEDGCSFGEKINTRPEMMILERDQVVNLANTFETIEKDEEDGVLSRPLRAFFGDMDRRGVKKNNPSIVIYDEKVNVDQLQVIYNALKKPVTYVQGPPGTGKTNTIFNLLISLYFSNKTALVCTNNNKPVDGIIERFTKEGDYISTIEFPYIRLGNKEVMIDATKKLIRLLEIDLPEIDKDADIEEDDLDIDEKNKNDELVELLNLYDKKRELTENTVCAQKLLSSAKKGKGNDHGIISAIEKQLEEFEKENEKYPEVKNADALSKVTIASTSESFRKAILNDSIKRIRKLRGSLFKSLRECLLIQDDEERVKSFNKWLISPGNTELLTKVFPIIFCTNISADKLGRDYKFDIAIMDESGQCDMAKALIPISRAERMLLVGDPAQLQPVIVLDRSVNESLKEKYLIDDKFDYVKQSILTHCLDSDKVSARLMLSYHYRSSKQIAYFASRRFYNGKLKLDFAKQEGQIKFFNCENAKASTKDHEALDEAYFIVNYIKKYGLDKEKQGNVLIITPFKQQAELINRLLKSKGVENIVASTIHSVQGGEADTIFFSAAVSSRTKTSTYKWLSEQDEIINVAWTRAKKNIFLFGDATAIKALTRQTGNKDSALLAAVDYAQNNGNVVVVPSQNEFFAFGKSNGSTSEDEFSDTITQLFTVDARFTCARNVKCSKVFANAPEFKGKEYEYDFVIYQKNIFGALKPYYIFEINGSEHYTVDKRIKTDKLKQEVATKNGVKYCMVPNDQVKDYEMFKMLINIGTDKKMTVDEKDKMVQMTLFSEEEE